MSAPPQIILASQSPRRRELLEHMGLKFTVVPSGFDEYLDHGRSPEEVATELALGKAREVARRYPDAIVIGADTIVTINGQQLGKPHDAAEAQAWIKLLSGTHHEVSTGVAVLRLADHTELTGAVTSHIYFKPYDEAAVARYVATGDPLDKAGGYGLQSGAGQFVERIEGPLDNVIGLPTQVLAELLSKLGIRARAGSGIYKLSR